MLSASPGSQSTARKPGSSHEADHQYALDRQLSPVGGVGSGYDPNPSVSLGDRRDGSGASGELCGKLRGRRDSPSTTARRMVALQWVELLGIRLSGTLPGAWREHPAALEFPVWFRLRSRD